jgi:DNA processing protein
MTEELLHQLALQFVPGVGNGNAKQLISYCGSASEVFISKAGTLDKIPGIGSKTIQAIRKKSTFQKAESILRTCAEKRYQVLHFTSKNYPSNLKTVYDAPNILYFQGKGNLSPVRSVAIVGTRSATAYGKSITSQTVRLLKPLNVTIVSGLAYGIDIEAHKASIQNNMPTIAVIAGGLDRIYPSRHIKYIDEIIRTGGILSENPPGTKPEAHLFPARNRIIAGLADATIVVEAAIKGGALITANIADSYDRPVFAIPGNLGQTYSTGCNALIKSQKALIYTDTKDLVYHLNWDGESIQERNDIELDPQETTIVSLLRHEPTGYAIDELCWKSQIQINQLATVLLNLEFKGVIRTLPGKKYQLI